MRNSALKKYRKFVKSFSIENEYQPNEPTRKLKKTSMKYVMKHVKKLHHSIVRNSRYNILDHLRNDLNLKT